MTPQEIERGRRLQRAELEVRISWLRDHIEKFDPGKYLEHRTAFAQTRGLVAAWTAELAEKRQLKLDLAEGRSVSQREVDFQTRIVPILARFNASTGRHARENAMKFGPRKR
ncbi:MAG: hypothetical protein Q8S00_01430 [Deltaproteobacteria bacterium]|nr:hypothetical protein [Deltaproteobacteria bacterium]